MLKLKLMKLGLALAGLTALMLITSCVPAEGSEQDTMSNITLVIFLVVIIVFIYFSMIRPQRKQQQKQREMMAQLKRGDKVVTAAGIYGEIESIDANSVVIKVESGATIRVVKNSVIVRRE